MNKIEKIRAEIERLKKNSELAKMEWINEGYNQNAFAEDCRIGSFDTLLSFLDTLSEEPDKDLEEAAKEYATTHLRNNEFPTADRAFIAGAKWQEEHTPLPEDTVLFQKGVAEGKGLMMEDLPKWYKVERGACFDKPTNFILSAKEGHFYCSALEVPRDGYILLVDELERLPKEDEK